MEFSLNNPSNSVARFIAIRYVSAGKRSHLVSFMSAISIVGLSLGVAILIIVLSVMNGFDREIRENVLGIVPHITISSDENLNIQEWIEIEEIASQVSAVETIAPAIQASGIVATNSGNKSVLVTGINPELEAEISIIDQFFVEGDLISLAQNRWGMAIGETLANRLEVKVGDSLNLYSTVININPLTPLANYREFEIVGVFKIGNHDLDNELVVININSAKALFRLRSPFNGLRIRTTDVLKANETLESINNLLPMTVTIDSWSAQFGAIYENIQFSKAIIAFLLWLLIGVAAFNLIVSLTMIIRDKKADIAILRTLGASPELIRKIFIWQGGVIGVLGTLIGILIGIIGSLQISNLIKFLEGILSTNFLDAEVYPIDFLPSQLSSMDVLLVAGSVFALSLLVTIYPARRAAAIQPAEILRSE